MSGRDGRGSPMALPETRLSDGLLVARAKRHQSPMDHSTPLVNKYRNKMIDLSNNNSASAS